MNFFAGLLRARPGSSEPSLPRLLAGLFGVWAWQALWAHLVTRSLAPLLAAQELFDSEWLARPDSLLVELVRLEADVLRTALASTLLLLLLSPLALLPSRALLLVLATRPPARLAGGNEAARDAPTQRASLLGEVGRLLAPLGAVTGLGLGLVVLFGLVLLSIFGAWLSASEDAAGGLSGLGTTVALVTLSVGGLALALFQDASAIGARRQLPLLGALELGVGSWRSPALLFGRALKALLGLALAAGGVAVLPVELSPHLELLLLQACAVGWLALDFGWFVWLDGKLPEPGAAPAREELLPERPAT